MSIPTDKLSEGMEVALGQAIQSIWTYAVDMPVGAVALKGDEIVGRGHADDHRTGNQFLHAEAVAFQDTQGESFDTIVTTLEPCIQCQDFMAGIDGLKRVVFGLSREEASSRNLVRYHEESAVDRALRLGFGYEIIQLQDERLDNIGKAVLDSVKRSPETGEVVVNDVLLLTTLVKLTQRGHSL